MWIRVKACGWGQGWPNQQCCHGGSGDSGGQHSYDGVYALE